MYCSFSRGIMFKALGFALFFQRVFSAPLRLLGLMESITLIPLYPWWPLYMFCKASLLHMSMKGKQLFNFHSTLFFVYVEGGKREGEELTFQ